MGKPRPSRIKPETLQREADVLKLRRAGFTFDLIAKQLNYSHASGAQKAYVNACKRIVYSEVEEVRAIEMDRLDIAQSAIWQNVLRGDTQAVNSLIRIMERRAKLLGLDAPTRQQVEVTTYEGGSELDREIQRLAQLLADGSGKQITLDEPASTHDTSTA